MVLREIGKIMITEFWGSFSLRSDQVPVVFMPKMFSSSLNWSSDSWISVLLLCLFHVLLTMRCLKCFLAPLELYVLGSVASGFSWTICVGYQLLCCWWLWLDFLGYFEVGVFTHHYLGLISYPLLKYSFWLCMLMYLDWFTASKHYVGLSVLG